MSSIVVGKFGLRSASVTGTSPPEPDPTASRHRPKRPVVPVATSRLHGALTNRYHSATMSCLQIALTGSKGQSTDSDRQAALFDATRPYHNFCSGMIAHVDSLGKGLLCTYSSGILNWGSIGLLIITEILTNVKHLRVSSAGSI